MKLDWIGPQISILIVMALLGTACFAWVDVKSRRRSSDAEQQQQELNSYGTMDKWGALNCCALLVDLKKMYFFLSLVKILYKSVTTSSSHVSDQIGDRTPLPTHENQSWIGCRRQNQSGIGCWGPKMRMRASATNFELSLTWELMSVAALKQHP